MTATKYRDMVANILAKMFAIRADIHPTNRNAVDKYLRRVWMPISTLTSSLVRTSQPESLQARFKSYVDAEEKRLSKNLETVKYDIDGRDTLLLVTGPGRIEKVSSIARFFPVTFMLRLNDVARSISSPFCGSFSNATSRSSAYVDTPPSTKTNCGIPPRRSIASCRLSKSAMTS